MDERFIQQGLSALAAESTDGTPVYIAGGKLHKLNGSSLQSEEFAGAAPYLWPIGHDVRPAAQSLGAKGCQDCHSSDSAFFFGNVAVDSPLASDRGTPWKMNRFETKIDPAYQAKLADTWRYRSMLKIVALSAAGLLGLFLLAYLFRGIDRISAFTTARFR